jgi:hypothetical protein
MADDTTTVERTSLAFLRQRKKVCPSLRKKNFFKITHSISTEMAKPSISKYLSHPSNPSTHTLSLPSAMSVTQAPMTLMS